MNREAFPLKRELGISVSTSLSLQDLHSKTCSEPEPHHHHHHQLLDPSSQKGGGLCLAESFPADTCDETSGMICDRYGKCLRASEW